MTNNNNDNKNIKFTGDPVAFDGVEGKRDPKTGKGRFDLIPEEVFGPLFDRVHKLETTDPYTVNCTPASILNDIANENMLDAIIKITILKYYNTDSAIDAMCCQIEAGAFLECCWDMFMDLAIHFQKGAEHYGERNCQKGIPKWSFKDSAMRHASQTFAGKTDEPHTISVVWNCWLFVWSEIHERQEAEAIAAADKVLEEMQAKRKAVKATILTGTRVPTLAEIEAAKSATPTPELKTTKLQAAPCAIGLDSMNHEDVKQWIETLKKFAEEHEFPIMTAIQHFYTREEVEAIKKEAVDKAIEDFLNDRSSENVDRIIKEIGSGVIVDRLKTIPLAERQLFDKQFADLLSTPEGKDRARWFYNLDDLFKDLIDRIENKRGLDQDYLPLLIKLNTVYGDYLQAKNDSEESNVQKVDVKIHSDHEITQEQRDKLKKFCIHLRDKMTKLNFEFGDGKDKWDKLIDEMAENAKEAGIPWPPKEPAIVPDNRDDYYSQTKLCRCPTDSLMGELHKRLVLINKSENIVKLNFVTNNREKLAKLTHLIDSIKRCDVDSKTTVDTVEIQRIIHQLREEMRKAYNVFIDTDGKYVRVFFNQLRPGMNNMIAMWNSIALLLNNEKTPDQ